MEVRELRNLGLALVLLLGIRIFGLMALAPSFESVGAYYTMQQLAVHQAPRYHLFPVGESMALIYMAVVPYWLLQGLIPLQVVFYGEIMAFVLLGGLVAYLLARRLLDARAGLLAIVLLAVYPTAEVAQTNWLGDLFAPILLLASLLLLLWAVDAHDRWEWDRFFLLMLASAFTIVMAWGIWSGGFYAVVIWCFAILFLWLRRYADFRTSFAVMLLLGVAAYGIYILVGSIDGIGSGYISVTPYYTIELTFMTQDYPFIANGAYAYQGVGLLPDMALSLMAMLLGAWYMLRGTALQKDGVAVLLLAYLLISPYPLSEMRYNSLIILPLAVLGGIGISSQRRFNGLGWNVLIVIGLGCLVASVATSAIAPYQTAGFLRAMGWVRNNTPSNSIFVSHSSETGPIEYYGNRTAYPAPIYSTFPQQRPFNNFLLSRACNLSYFRGSNASYVEVESNWHPDDYYWAWLDLPAQTNLSDPSFDGSNLQALLSGDALSCDNVTLAPVWLNYTYIFKVEK